MLRSFEQAVIGLSLEESTTVRILADETEEAYGPSEVVLDLDQFPPDEPPEIGIQYQVPLDDGRVIVAVVTDISGSRVTLKNTIPPAGEDVTFEITLVEIVQPS